MKKAFTILVILVISLGVKAHATDATVLNGKATAKSVAVAPKDEQMTVKFILEPIGEWNVKSNQTLRFTPMLKNGDKSIELPAIEVRGKKSYVYYYRNKNAVDAQTVVRNNNAQPIKYSASVPMESWMLTARLVLVEDRCQCVSTLKESSTSELKQRTFNAAYAFAEPVKECNKERKEVGSYVDYKLSKTAIDSAYEDNSSEIMRMTTLLNSLKNDSAVEIQSVVITGYASPEGLIPLNTELAAKRAHSMYSFIQSIYPLSEKIFTIKNGGEDWAALKDCVNSSPDFEGKDKIIHVMNDTSFMNDDAREWVMKSEYKDAYKHIYDMCYPSLRKATYLISYTVGEYDVAKARAIMKNNPGKLSAYEMCQVAKSYPEGSMERRGALATALMYYPDDSAVNLDNANIAIADGDFNLARSYMGKVADSPEKLNAEAIILMQEGNLNSARELWQKAAGQGCEAAKTNLENLNE